MYSATRSAIVRYRLESLSSFPEPDLSRESIKSESVLIPGTVLSPSGRKSKLLELGLGSAKLPAGTLCSGEAWLRFPTADGEPMIGWLGLGPPVSLIEGLRGSIPMSGATWFGGPMCLCWYGWFGMSSCAPCDCNGLGSRLTPSPVVSCLLAEPQPMLTFVIKPPRPCPGTPEECRSAVVLGCCTPATLFIPKDPPSVQAVQALQCRQLTVIQAQPCRLSHCTSSSLDSGRCPWGAPRHLDLAAAPFPRKQALPSQHCLSDLRQLLIPLLWVLILCWLSEAGLETLSWGKVLVEEWVLIVGAQLLIKQILEIWVDLNTTFLFKVKDHLCVWLATGRDFSGLFFHFFQGHVEYRSAAMKETLLQHLQNCFYIIGLFLEKTDGSTPHGSRHCLRKHIMNNGRDSGCVAKSHSETGLPHCCLCAI
ncbi:hypothetical protein INR49_021338 [Caranx melampygus]|nr:hypothetical protein INR49_021338 [Caranx melampygus]